MKVIIWSDLHLEYLSTKRLEVVTKQLSKVDTDILILAGDIGNRERVEEFLSLLHDIHPSLIIIYVLGNHEFFDENDWNETKRRWKEYAKDRRYLHILDKEAICISGIRFWGSTLWSDINDAATDRNDYKRINVTPKETRGEFEDSFKKLVEYDKYIDVIITHHLPTIHSIDKKYKNKDSSAYYTELDYLIKGLSPRIWIHGHTHTSLDYIKYNTRIICNPRGKEGENPNFDPNCMIDIQR